MPQLSDILRIAVETTCMQRAPQRLEHAADATIDLTTWQGSADTIMHAGLAVRHPMATMLLIDVSAAQGTLAWNQKRLQLSDHSYGNPKPI